MVNKVRGPTYRAPAIERAAQILWHLTECPTPPTLSDIARALGYGKSTVHGLLHTLEGMGWIENAGGGFRVGNGFLRLARRAFGLLELAEVAKPLMEQLAERIGESILLGIRRGEQVVILDWAEGSGEMRVSSRPGVTLPLLAAAVGKVFLAGMPPDEPRRFLADHALPRFTERSITDPEQFLAAVEQTREQGFATDDEEYLRGVRAVAAPIRFRNRTVAALWVVGFSSHLTEPNVERTAFELRQTCKVISKLLLGYSQT